MILGGKEKLELVPGLTGFFCFPLSIKPGSVPSTALSQVFVVEEEGGVGQDGPGQEEAEEDGVVLEQGARAGVADVHQVPHQGGDLVGLAEAEVVGQDDRQDVADGQEDADGVQGVVCNRRRVKRETDVEQGCQVLES